ncbi:YncE family protein [Terriglobus sp. TAA 43]|uniref:YncE family protein n=1 Tax=Terriglobus sp. TAA 43 TaxID=278961 RepID=UPI00064701F2|nr:hypothetical protein [Terriglobus sp. TAA 43]
MKKHCLNVLLCCATSVSPLLAQQATTATGAPLSPVNTFALPKLGVGNFDHLAVDITRNRLFVTPEEAKMIIVLDANAGTILHEVAVERPHALFYRPDTDRLYVTDGLDGSVRIFDANSFQQVERVPLWKDADAMGYDISKRTLYVASGGKDLGEKSSHLSVIDTATNRKVQDIAIEGETLEAMAMDVYRPKLYINNTARNTVTVVNRYTHSVIANWPLKSCTNNVAMALDEPHQRLFVGCRSKQIVVMDTNTGAELQTLPIHDGVDDLTFDPASHRIYASTNGFVEVFEQQDLDHYTSLGSVVSAEKARTSRLVPEWSKFFVAAPKSASSPARIFAFEPQNTPSPPAPKVEVKEAVNAPYALQILSEEMTQHPTLRKMGLHAIPPGQQAMVIIANVNETRIGVHTSASDFAATKEGKTAGPLIKDGQFFNMKMPLFDALGKTIGILVMEIPHTDVSTEEEAARMAESIRAEIARKIPTVSALFAHN